MPLLNEEENYNLQQLELIQSGSSQYSFPTTTGDYINLNIYDSSNIFRVDRNSQIYVEGDSSIPGNFQYIIDATNSVRVKPNDILDNLDRHEELYH